jgi:hypothetical protein
MLDVWSEKSGYSFGTFEEGITVTIPLPLKTLSPSQLQDLKFSVISGKLPPGLRIDQQSFYGTPVEVARVNEFEFVIRAQQISTSKISDRTYKISIEGADQPEFLTKADLLPIGPNKTYFILDSSPVDFQLDAFDQDTAAGQELNFFIEEKEGTLPPGLSMDRKGRITGFIDPLLAVPVVYRDGGYDTEGFDAFTFDYGIRPDNGFDSFKFDSITFDYSAPFRGPKKLNRNYFFVVTITDGDTFVKRKFRIYVVGEDYLRADNTIIKVGTSTYLASASSLRTPFWRTQPNLGIIRSNNYNVLKLDLYDVIDFNSVQYYLEERNPDSSLSQLPLGMRLDIKTGEIFGLLPYQTQNYLDYTFTITATRFGNDNESASSSRTFNVRVLGEIDSKMNWITDSFLGTIGANFISNLKIEATSTLPNPIIEYTILEGTLPPGLTLELTGEITGRIRQYSQNQDEGLTTFYDTLNGQVINNQTFDGGETEFDRSYKFVIRAKDQVNYSNIDREFTLNIDTPNDRLYSNLYVTTYMELDKRRLFENLVDNESVFPQSHIYRYNDPNFGIRKDLKMLVYAGIETKNAGEYISIIGLNHKKKRLRFGDIKIAKARNEGSNKVIYEVVYVEMIDSMDFVDRHLPLVSDTNPPGSKNISADMSNYIWNSEGQDLYIGKKEPYLPRPFENITIDRTNIFSSDPNQKKRYPNTIYNWRQRIRMHKDLNGVTLLTEQNFLPLWMRSFQDNRQELGFVLALPLCFCKPDMAYNVVLNLKNYIQTNQFDFKNLDYTIDRYIIDSVTGYGNDKYLVFKDQEATI